MPQSRDRPACRELAAGIAARHGRRLPASGDLHLDQPGPGSGEGLRGPDPERMTGNPTLDTGFGGARLDDGAGGAIRDRFGQDHPVAADAPEQRAVMDAAGVAPRRDPSHGRFADEQYRAFSFLVRLAAMHGEPAGPVRLGFEVGNLSGDGLGHAEQAIAGERDKCSVAKPGKLPVAIGCHGGNGIGFGPLEAPYLAAATPAPLAADPGKHPKGLLADWRWMPDQLRGSLHGGNGKRDRFRRESGFMTLGEIVGDRDVVGVPALFGKPGVEACERSAIGGNRAGARAALARRCAASESGDTAFAGNSALEADIAVDNAVALAVRGMTFPYRQLSIGTILEWIGNG